MSRTTPLTVTIGEFVGGLTLNMRIVSKLVDLIIHHCLTPGVSFFMNSPGIWEDVSEGEDVREGRG